MYILPAIDMYDHKAVRLLRGDYEKMTVYSDNPVEIALDFREAGAEYIHMVDLEGAKVDGTPNYDVVKDVIDKTGLKVEIGGGIRTEETVKKYLDAGVERVILGTAAVTDRDFLESVVEKYGKRIAVGVDLKDGYAAIKGWMETSSLKADEFIEYLSDIGVKTVIVTDISKDGAMKGTNRNLYKSLSEKYDVDLIASGGVSSMDDILALNELGIAGAIVGKAYYIHAIDLKEAIEAVR